MSDFEKSAWADDKFAGNYLDKADIYIIERRKLLGIVSSLFAHYYRERANIRVLDLGCGDGVLTNELAKINSSISATLVDGNEGMLLKAKIRLKSLQDPSFVLASFQDILAGRAKLETFDLCISSMAIHHLEMSEKVALFRLIASHLSKGGHFIDVDVVLPPSGSLEGWYFEMWEAWIKEMMGRANISDETPDAVIKRYQDPASMNRPDTLNDQLKALEDAGFSDVDCYYKNGIFTVFGGRRP